MTSDASQNFKRFTFRSEAALRCVRAEMNKIRQKEHEEFMRERAVKFVDRVLRMAKENELEFDDEIVIILREMFYGWSDQEQNEMFMLIKNKGVKYAVNVLLRNDKMTQEDKLVDLFENA
jgi:hypothetical protein